MKSHISACALSVAALLSSVSSHAAEGQPASTKESSFVAPKTSVETQAPKAPPSSIAAMPIDQALGGKVSSVGAQDQVKPGSRDDQRVRDSSGGRPPTDYSNLLPFGE
jgi:hypothetical protein